MVNRALEIHELRRLSLETPLISERSVLKGGKVNVRTRVVGNASPNPLYVRPLGIYFAISGLLITTTLSVFVLISNARGWRLSGDNYSIVTRNRASIQLIVQVLSNILGLVYITTICTLLNYATRIRLGSHAINLDVLRFWHALCTRSVDWTFPFQLLLPLLMFVTATAIPSAIWAGALTPVITTITSNSTTLVPSYDNSTFIHEWPSEIDSGVPLLRNNKGLFTYSVGVQMQGNLLASAASATPADGGVRQHSKLDYSQFIYHGRSYGIGAAVGLLDQNISSDQLALSYVFQETGYSTTVSCIYNTTAGYFIEPNGASDRFVARGMLPNSGDLGEEFSIYYGHGPQAIVAIGVARPDRDDSRRMLGIAAGESYSHLNTTQCTIDFVPTMFNVSVGLAQRNLTVVPDTTVTERQTSVSASHNLTNTVTRQLELIANDQTNLYVSLVGNSLNASISDYITAHAAVTRSNKVDEIVTLREATLAGLENAFTVMLDDMLVAYASAQLMIAGQNTEVIAHVTSTAMGVGQDIYIYAVFAVNLVVLTLITSEAIRTRWWRQLVALDYLDPAALVVASWKGKELSSTSGRRVAIGTHFSAANVADAKDVMALLHPDMSLSLASRVVDH